MGDARGPGPFTSGHFFVYQDKKDNGHLILAAKLTMENIHELAEITGAEHEFDEPLNLHRLKFKKLVDHVWLFDTAEPGDYIISDMGRSYWPMDMEIFEAHYAR